jgi:hypothetical protein
MATLHARLEKVIERFTKSANDDLYRGLFTGCPNPNDPDEIRGVSDWLEGDGPCDWNKSQEWCDSLAGALREAANDIEGENTGY